MLGYDAIDLSKWIEAVDVSIDATNDEETRLIRDLIDLSDFLNKMRDRGVI